MPTNHYIQHSLSNLVWQGVFDMMPHGYKQYFP